MLCSVIILTYYTQNSRNPQQVKSIFEVLKIICYTSKAQKYSVLQRLYVLKVSFMHTFWA